MKNIYALSSIFFLIVLVLLSSNQASGVNVPNDGAYTQQVPISTFVYRVDDIKITNLPRGDQVIIGNILNMHVYHTEVGTSPENEFELKMELSPGLEFYVDYQPPTCTMSNRSLLVCSYGKGTFDGSTRDWSETLKVLPLSGNPNRWIKASILHNGVVVDPNLHTKTLNFEVTPSDVTVSAQQTSYTVKAGELFSVPIKYGSLGPGGPYEGFLNIESSAGSKGTVNIESNLCSPFGGTKCSQSPTQYSFPSIVIDSNLQLRASPDASGLFQIKLNAGSYVRDPNPNNNAVKISVNVMPQESQSVDSDGDGVPDTQDQCRTTPGPASNNGCPLIISQTIDLRFKPNAFLAVMASDLSNTLKAGSPIRLGQDIENLGNTPAGPFCYSMMLTDQSGRLISSYNNIQKGTFSTHERCYDAHTNLSIGYGAYHEIIIAEPGTYTVTFTTDYKNQVIETNEQNNVVVNTIIVGGTSLGLPPVVSEYLPIQEYIYLGVPGVYNKNTPGASVVRVFDNKGNFVKDFVPLDTNNIILGILHMDWGSDNHLFVSNGAKSIDEYSNTGQKIRELVDLGNPGYIHDGINYNAASDFHFRSGHLYVLSPSMDVRKYNADTGQFVDYFIHRNDNGGMAALQMEFGRDGKLYIGSGQIPQVPTSSNHILVFNSNGVLEKKIPRQGIGNVLAMKFGSDGMLYLVEGSKTTSSNTLLNAYDIQNDKFSRTLVDFSKFNVYGITDFEFSSDGTLIALHTWDGVVNRYDKNGNLIETLVSQFNLPGEPGSGLNVEALLLGPHPSSKISYSQNESQESKQNTSNENKNNDSDAVPQNIKIPNWIKGVAGFWCEGKISDKDFVEAIQFLIKEKYIKVPSSSSGVSSQKIPSWIKSNACWWAEGLLSDAEFANALQFLIKNKIIRI